MVTEYKTHAQKLIDILTERDAKEASEWKDKSSKAFPKLLKGYAPVAKISETIYYGTPDGSFGNLDKWKNDMGYADEDPNFPIPGLIFSYKKHGQIVNELLKMQQELRTVGVQVAVLERDYPSGLNSIKKQLYLFLPDEYPITATDPRISTDIKTRSTSNEAELLLGYLLKKEYIKPREIPKTGEFPFNKATLERINGRATQEKLKAIPSIAQIASAR